MTYLDLVNNVLRRLRERPVESVDQTEYSRLIGILVNDAKTTVEEAWLWSALRTTLSATTTEGIFRYELQGAKNNPTFLDVINDTENFFMSYRTSKQLNSFFNNTEPQVGSPHYYGFNGVSSDGDTQVDIYPIPDGEYELRFNIVRRTPEFTEDSNVFDVPSRPIELLAYAMAVEERGEDAGNTAQRAYDKAMVALSDAIALDSDKHPEETIWYQA